MDNNILPFILESLSKKPKSEESEKTLLKELRLKFKNENLKINNFTKGFQQAIEIGEDLGIFRLVGENIRLPFSLESKKKQQQTESKTSRSKSAPGTTSKKSNLTQAADKVHRTSRRRRSSSKRGKSQSRSRSRRRSRSGAHGRSQSRRRGSRR